jgi:hypothetical protein
LISGVGSTAAAQWLSALKCLQPFDQKFPPTAILCEIQVAVKGRERLRGVRWEMNGDTVRIRDPITFRTAGDYVFANGLIDCLRRLHN